MRVTTIAFVLAVAATVPASAQPPTGRALPDIATHDNVRSAGELKDGALSLRLWAGMGRWYPEGPRGRARPVAAIGEEGGPLVVPSPLVRAPRGTVVHVSIRNALPAPLRIRGFCDKPGPCEPFAVPSGGSRDVRFTLQAAGTFHYWAETDGTPLPLRRGDDSQLGGAIVSDDPGREEHDRVFVLGMKAGGTGPDAPEVLVINGRSWPHTERLEYAAEETVRWRVVNLSAAPHAMHLHGFFFTVASTGNGSQDTHYAPADRPQAVTHQMPPGSSVALEWVPERPGRWLFHCHMLGHMMSPHQLHGGAAAPHGDDSAAGMAGLVLGIHVTGGQPDVDVPRPASRQLTMLVQPDGRHRPEPGYKVDLLENGRALPRLGDRAVPGPVMVLTRGVPVAVEIQNRLETPTAIHWHGIELESYHDGVPEFGGHMGSVTPPVAPRDSFTARFTPSRAGTFIYHTHWHDPAQLSAGVYGPLIVLEPGEAYEPSQDHIVVLGLDGPYRQAPDEPFAVNGEKKPGPLDLEAGVPNRLRFINITGDNVALTVQLLSGFDPVRWTLVGKDGAAAPATQRTERSARQLVSVGETYDFELAPLPPTPVGLWMELRRGSGELLMQWPVRVR